MYNDRLEWYIQKGVSVLSPKTKCFQYSCCFCYLKPSIFYSQGSRLKQPCKSFHFKLGDRTPKKKNLYYSFDCDGNLHMYVKLKLRWVNFHDFFSIFFIENVLFTENVKKGVRGNEPNDRTVQPTHLRLISIEAEIHALQKYREFFFEFCFSFQVILFFRKLHFCLKNWNSRGRYFFKIRNLNETLCGFVDHKIALLLIPKSVL